VENIYFLLDEKDWRESYFNVAKSASLARAKIIHKGFISSNGNFSINISSETAQEIGHKLQEVEVEQDVFAHAVSEISQLLRIGPMQRFLGSEQYEKIASEQQVEMPLKRVSSFAHLSNFAATLRGVLRIRNNSKDSSAGEFSEVPVSDEDKPLE
jgi:hypothetical protein